MMRAKQVGFEKVNRLVTVNGVICLEGPPPVGDYVWDGNDLIFRLELNPLDDIKVYSFAPDIAPHIATYKPEEKSKRDAFHQPIEPSDTVAENPLVVADWGVLMDIVDECPYEIIIHDLPGQDMMGFACPATGEVWQIKISNAKKTGPKEVMRLETRGTIICEHSVKINK